MFDTAEGYAKGHSEVEMCVLDAASSNESNWSLTGVVSSKNSAIVALIWSSPQNCSLVLVLVRMTLVSPENSAYG